MTDGALSWCSLSYGFDENPIAMNQTINNFFSAIKAKWPYDSLSLSLFNRPRVPQQHKLPVILSKGANAEYTPSRE